MDRHTTRDEKFDLVDDSEARPTSQTEGMSSTSRTVGLGRAAAEAAARAAFRGGIEIKSLEGLDAITDVASLFRTIWGPDEQDLIGVSTLRALAHSGNYLSGAYLEGELIGANVGFLGWYEGTLQLHSHILGVLPMARGRNVGFALKQHQRAWCIERDIFKVTWTFDPLVSRNAYFNLTKLGASVTSYYVGFYGTMNDQINGQDESDRVLVEWTLDSPRAVAASVGEHEIPDESSFVDRGGEVILQVGPDGAPVERPASSNTLLVGIPADVVQLRRDDKDRAAMWRRSSRAALQPSLNDGYAIQAMTRSGYYVLERVS